MAKAAPQTIHTRIRLDRSICGMAPKNGQYNIQSFPEFFAAPKNTQCERCRTLVVKHGYSLKKLDAQYQPLVLPPVLQHNPESESLELAF